jgi:hypothetical protein
LAAQSVIAVGADVNADSRTGISNALILFLEVTVVDVLIVVLLVLILLAVTGHLRL